MTNKEFNSFLDMCEISEEDIQNDVKEVIKLTNRLNEIDRQITVLQIEKNMLKAN